MFSAIMLASGYGRDTEDDGLCERNLQKLAQKFEVDPDRLVAQHAFWRPVAQRIFVEQRCDTKTAWRLAMEKASRSRVHAVDALLPVLVRHAAYGISTSGVEQTFSVFKRVFGDQRLGGSEESEVCVLKLLFDRR